MYVSLSASLHSSTSCLILLIAWISLSCNTHTQGGHRELWKNTYGTEIFLRNSCKLSFFYQWNMNCQTKYSHVMRENVCRLSYKYTAAGENHKTWSLPYDQREGFYCSCCWCLWSGFGTFQILWIGKNRNREGSWESAIKVMEEIRGRDKSEDIKHNNTKGERGKKKHTCHHDENNSQTTVRLIEQQGHTSKQKINKRKRIDKHRSVSTAWLENIYGYIKSRGEKGREEGRWL